MIWLIGNKGMLGKEVEELLRQRNLPYIASDIEVDITNQNMLEQFVSDKSFSWIINCSAYTAVDKAEDEPELAFRINAEGPRNIAEIAKNKGAKLIHISTDYVFDGTKQGAYVETDAPNPLGIYGKSKLQGEGNIKEVINEYFIIRTAWLYGWHGNNFVYTMLRLFKKCDEINIVCDQFGSPTYAPDLAAAILKIISLDEVAYGIYHFTNEGEISWYDFAREIYRKASEKKLINKEVSICRITTIEYPTKAKRPQNSYLSKDKICKTFNIEIRSCYMALSDFFKREVL